MRHWIDEVSESLMTEFLTVIPQTPSSPQHMQEMFEAVVSGATGSEIQGVEVNLGYLSGAMKQYLDEYPLISTGKAS